MDNDANPPPVDNKTYNKLVSVKQIYAFTVTYKAHRRLTAQGQFNDTIPYLTKLLNESTEFKLIPEWRMTTGDIHYHGILQIVDPIKWIKHTIRALKRLGFILIKPIDNLDKWTKYYTKEENIARAIVGDGITLPITKVIEVMKVKRKEEAPPDVIPDIEIIIEDLEIRNDRV